MSQTRPSYFDQTRVSPRNISSKYRAAGRMIQIRLWKQNLKFERSPSSAITYLESVESPRSRPTLLTSVAAEYPQTQCFAVPVNDVEEGYEYPGVVRFEIEEQDLSSYQRAADFINIGNVDIVCVQHEFGIYGGPAGRHLLALVHELKMPVVTTFHTILRDPNDTQRRVMQELIARSTRLVTMTERGRQMLEDVYRAPSAKIDLIPHGIPDIPVCRSQLLQGPVWRRRADGVAHLRAAFAQ